MSSDRASGVSIGHVRSLRAYEIGSSTLENHFRSRYVTLPFDALSAAHRRWMELRPRLWAIVPMAEHLPELAPTVRQAAEYLSGLLPGGHTLFLDGGSCTENVDAARAGGAVVLRQDQLLDALDWDRLLPLLNLPGRPYGRAGQGLNVLAGHIALAAQGLEEDALVFQGDADVDNYHQLRPFERLFAAWLQDEEVRHLKQAKFGRNNEGTMIARAMQQLWGALELDWVPPAVKDMGHDVFMALGPDKWMTCGLYLVRGEIVWSRTFATGYLDATTQALWTIHAPECGWHRVRHVENPAPCRDAENTAQKETLIMTQIALFLQAITMMGRPLYQWDLREICALNQRVMPKLRDIPVIGDTDGPVSVHALGTERIVPSVRALCDATLLDLAKARGILRRAGLS